MHLHQTHLKCKWYWLLTFRLSKLRERFRYLKGKKLHGNYISRILQFLLDFAKISSRKNSWKTGNLWNSSNWFPQDLKLLNHRKILRKNLLNIHLLIMYLLHLPGCNLDNKKQEFKNHRMHTSVCLSLSLQKSCT